MAERDVIESITDKLTDKLSDKLIDKLLSDDRNRGVGLSEGNFTFDDGDGNITFEEAKRNKITAFRLTKEQHRLWKEWCMRHELSQSDAFLEAFTLMRNKHGA